MAAHVASQAITVHAWSTLFGRLGKQTAVLWEDILPFAAPILAASLVHTSDALVAAAVELWNATFASVRWADNMRALF